MGAMLVLICVCVHVMCQLSIQEPFYRNMQWFRGELVFEAHRLVYHSA